MSFLVTLVALGMQLTNPIDGLDSVFSDSKSAYVLADPLCAGDDGVREGFWAPDSSKIAYVQYSITSWPDKSKPLPIPSGKASLKVWNAKQRSIKTLWSGDFEKVQLGDPSWFGDGNAVLTPFYEMGEAGPKVTYITFNLNTGATTPVKLPTFTVIREVEGAKNSLLTAYDQDEQGTIHCTVLSSNGTSKTYTLQDKAEKQAMFYLMPAQMDASGSKLTIPVAGGGSGPTPKMEILEVNLATGLVTRGTKELKPNGESRGPTNTLKLGFTQDTGGGFYSLSCTKPGPIESAVISRDAQKVWIAPNEKSVAYVSRGALMVRPIVPYDLADALKAREVALKTKAIQDSKQAALALIMMASDMDDMLPDPNSDWKRTTQPYIKNAGIMDKFQYTFAGGSMAGVKDPGKTELGYIPGPGGRAVAYVDGSVRWVKD